MHLTTISLSLPGIKFTTSNPKIVYNFIYSLTCLFTRGPYFHPRLSHKSKPKKPRIIKEPYFSTTNTTARSYLSIRFWIQYFLVRSRKIKCRFYYLVTYNHWKKDYLSFNLQHNLLVSLRLRKTKGTQSSSLYLYRAVSCTSNSWLYQMLWCNRVKLNFDVE